MTESPPTQPTATPAPAPNPSLKDEPSQRPYNEQKARDAFGDEFIDKLKAGQEKFCGDWWQLAKLVTNLEADEKTPDIRPEDRLQDWNASIGSNPIHLEHVRLGWYHLEHANLRGAYLEHASFNSANLTRAKLGDAHLEHTTWENTRLEHAWLWDSHLEHADLTGAHLEHAYLDRAHLAHTTLSDAHLEYASLVDVFLNHARLNRSHLEHAKLDGARLEHADLDEAHLGHADLDEAHLGHADLRKAHFEHATLKDAVLDRADVRGATGLLFDGNRVEQMRIEGNAPDPWSVLRRQYTGPWFFVHLLFLILFFLPYASKALYLSAYSQAQERVIHLYDTMEDKLEASSPAKRLSRHVRRWMDRHHQPRKAWWVLIGGHRGWWVYVTAVVAIYNVLRAYLTLKVNALRDAEERSATTPTLKEYWRLYRLHQVAWVTMWVSLGVAAYNVGHWVFTTDLLVPTYAPVR